MPVIPLGDDNPHGSSSPVNWTFILISVAMLIFALVKDHDMSLHALQSVMLPLDAHFPFNAGLAKSFGFSLFIHQNPWQMALYLYMLWMLGDNIEYATGHFRYIIFFFICGYAGLAAQTWLVPEGNTLAIAGLGTVAFAVTGAYIACFPQIKINIIWFFKETNFSVKLLPGLFLCADLLASLWYPAGALKAIPELPLLQHMTVWVIHACGFLLGYALFFVFRDRDIVIDMPLPKKFRRLRTGGSDDWR